jgi:Cu-processing system permease protein
MSVWVITRLTFREASRRWVLWVALVLGFLFLAVFAFGFNEMHGQLAERAANPGNNVNVSRLMFSEMINFVLMGGLYAVNFLAILMTVLSSVDTLSGEIASGTIHTLVSKPLRRWELVLGKWLGFMGMLTLYLLVMAGGVMLIVYAISGYTPPNMLRGLALMWLNVALLLSITFLGGSLLSTLANGVFVFGLYGVAFIGGWIEQIGSFLENQNAINIGILCSLLMPIESIWKRAAFEMQSPMVSAFSGVSFFTSSSIPSPFMIIYGVLYTLVVLFLAARVFHKRDL